MRYSRRRRKGSGRRDRERIEYFIGECIDQGRDDITAQGIGIIAPTTGFIIVILSSILSSIGLNIT